MGTGRPKMGNRNAPKEWPAHFPVNCPPGDCPATNGPVFRFSTGNDAEDWDSWLERDIGRGQKCRRASLSCFLSLEHAREVAALSNKFRDAKILRANLGPMDGKIKQTGRDPLHNSLWLRLLAHERRRQLFREVP